MMTVAYFASFPFLFIVITTTIATSSSLSSSFLVTRTAAAKQSKALRFSFTTAATATTATAKVVVSVLVKRTWVCSQQAASSNQLPIAAANPISISPYCDIIRIIEPAVSNDADEGKSSYCLDDEGK